ncbi:MAG TPA: hypothetical protein VJM77_07395 [Nitrospiria bacterium]|nr:hypothetical protein [Nitrospiria bacterium]
MGWSPFNATRIETSGEVASNPQVAMDSSGNAMAVWVQGIDIWANRYVVGKGWGSPTLLENNSDPGLNPQVAINSSGNATAVWAQFDGKALSIWANGFN